LKEFKKNQSVLHRVSKPSENSQDRRIFKPAPMTTAKAIKSGENVQRAIAATENGSMTKTRLKEIVQEEPFKGVSVFVKFFGKDWQMIKRIAMDPSHELHNLVKDMLALILSVKSMDFKAKRLEEEKKTGRFSGLQASNQAPWIVGARRRTILSQLMKSNKLQIPFGWPKLLDYFSEDYQKLKIAESMAFCGDIGSYMLGQTDICDEIKELLLELLNVAGGFIKKASTQSELKR
jgi:hypothetical protein